MTLEKPTMSERACANCKGSADSRETQTRQNQLQLWDPDMTRHDQKKRVTAF